MKIHRARQLLSKDITQMTLEQLQIHKVHIIDAWRESRAEHGYEQAVRDGYYKVIACEYASGFSPSDIWLTKNLETRLDEIMVLEMEMLGGA